MRKKSKAADALLGRVIARLRAHDPQFREVLDLTLELDDEIQERRTRDV